MGRCSSGGRWVRKRKRTSPRWELGRMLQAAIRRLVRSTNHGLLSIDSLRGFRQKEFFLFIWSDFAARLVTRADTFFRCEWQWGESKDGDVLFLRQIRRLYVAIIGSTPTASPLDVFHCFFAGSVDKKYLMASYVLRLRHPDGLLLKTRQRILPHVLYTNDSLYSILIIQASQKNYWPNLHGRRRSREWKICI